MFLLGCLYALIGIDTVIHLLSEAARGDPDVWGWVRVAVGYSIAFALMVPGLVEADVLHRRRSR